MKIYILTCFNGEGAIISVDAYATLNEAHAAMVKAHNAETADLKGIGQYRANRDYVEQYAATVGDYVWRIWAREV